MKNFDYNIDDRGCVHDRLVVFRVLFLLDVFLAGVAQAALPFLLAAATALLGVLLTVCKIVVSHILKNNSYYYNNYYRL